MVEGVEDDTGEGVPTIKFTFQPNGMPAKQESNKEFLWCVLVCRMVVCGNIKPILWYGLCIIRQIVESLRVNLRLQRKLCSVSNTRRVNR